MAKGARGKEIILIEDVSNMNAVTSAYITSYVIVALVILLAVAAVGIIGYLIYHHLLCGLLAPTRRVVARVRLKKQREYEVEVEPYMLVGGVWGYLLRIINEALRRDNSIPLYHSWDYNITFVVNDRVVELYVPEEVYSDVSEGEQGLLVYKGNHFKHFIKGAISTSSRVG